MSVVFFHEENEAELLVCLMKSMRNDETIWKLLKAVHGTQVVSVHWPRLDQRGVAIHCSGQNGCGAWYDVIETSGTILDWSSSDWDQSPISRQPIAVGLLHGR